VPIRKALTKIIEILGNDRPAFFQEIPIEPVWPRGLIAWQILYNIINFLFCEFPMEPIKVLRRVD
jgi:hypothetical protein